MNEEPLKPEALVLKVQDLPIIPSAVAEILRVVNEPSASGVEIEWAVSRDQSVASRVLKVVNSAAYGLARRVETIREAVVMLGLRKVRDITASMAASVLFAKDPSGLVDGSRLWIHGLSTSLWARQIISTKRLSDMDVVVPSALLHDLGILVLHQFCPERYHAVLTRAREEKVHHDRIEKKMLKVSHSRIAATLCAKWKLPISMTQLINSHHQTMDVADPALAVLMLADHLSNEFNHGPFEWGCPPTIEEEVLEVLRMSDNDMQALLEVRGEVDEQVEEFKRAALS